MSSLDITLCAAPLEIPKCDNCRRNKKKYEGMELFMQSYTTPTYYLNENIFECNLYWSLTDENYQ